MVLLRAKPAIWGLQGFQWIKHVQALKYFQRSPNKTMHVKAFAMRYLPLSVFFCMSSTAIAGPSCTDAPKEQWIKADEMRAKIVAENYKIDVFKVTKGKCYEIYGRDKGGARVEIYFNPVTGEVVKASVLR